MSTLMIQRRAIIPVSLLALIAAVAPSSSKGDLIVSNFSDSGTTNNTALSYSVTNHQAGAQLFTMGASSYVLTDVVAYLGLGSGGSAYSGTYTATLAASSGSNYYNNPTTVLATMTGTIASGSPAQVTFTPTTGLVLMANTSYWFEIDTSSTSSGSILWRYITPSPAGNTVGTGATITNAYTTGTIPLSTNSNDSGVTLSQLSLQLDGTVVPEPSTFATATIGAVCASGYWWRRRHSVRAGS